MKDVTEFDKNAPFSAENADSTRNMPDLSVNGGGVSSPAISLADVAEGLGKSRREELLSVYDLKKFAKIFEDESMMETADTFISCGMNVSAAARKLYMHRNTLMYRLKLIYKKTGLDLRDFDMAVTFRMLHILYCLK